MKTYKYTFGFRGENQIPLFMFIREEYINEELYFAKVLFQIDCPWDEIYKK